MLEKNIVKEKKSIKSDFTLMAIMLIPIAIAINFVGGTLVGTLKLPLYLDSIGTFLIALLAGPWVGGLTGLVSILINSIADPTLAPYSLLAALAGLTAGFLARMKMFTSLVKAIISGLIVALMSVIGTVIIRVAFFGGFGTSGISAIIAGMISLGVPFWPAQFIGQFISEVPDKVISLIIPWIVVRSMSDRNLYKFSNGKIYIESRKKK